MWTASVQNCKTEKILRQHRDVLCLIPGVRSREQGEWAFPTLSDMLLDSNPVRRNSVEHFKGTTEKAAYFSL